MPKTATKENILKGMYKFQESKKKNAKAKAHLMGSGTILNEVRKAAEILEKQFNIAADIWSVTSYKELHRDIMDIERYNRMTPTKKAKEPFVKEITKNEKGIFIAASDYVQVLADSISRYLPGQFASLGTFGFGRSEGRTSLRDFFEVDAKHIAYAALHTLVQDGKLKADVLKKAVKDLKINSEKPNPLKS
ncbi:pyruvate dehydrogenase e1 component [hydrocarbon metagenome]|uniref:Pyruvate dehydrogenase e1 component n=1 Tax=hydrocarbon metagenome TaxID=938273 RepID=A0A0W8G1A3_9ZZZZ